MSQIQSSKSRRNFIKGAGMAGIATSFLPGQSLTAAKPRGIARAKNLIFLVVDGMSHGTLALAHHWNIRHKGERLNWMHLYERSGLHRSMQDTASLSSPVTDSAAAASAWGGGQRVHNGALNVTPEGKPLKPLLLHAKDAGKRVGLVSTCRITHATPAGFAANMPNRNNENAILQQYLEREIDVLLGGGARHFSQKNPNGGLLDYFQQFQKTGYYLARTRGELKAASRKHNRLLGIFSDSHVPYAIDRKNDPSLTDTPSLPEMFEAALGQLNHSKEGFVLQVEGGRVDHAGHANDPAAILQEQLEFDRCIPIATDFIEKHPDTLLIVTTDHGTGGCQLNGLGRAYQDSGPALDRINQFKHSFEWLEKRYKTSGEFDADLFAYATGITPSEKQAKVIREAIKDPKITYLNSMMTRAVADQLAATTATGWTSNNHTAENVELLAFGPGSKKIPGFLQNFELNGIMRDALQI
jgi:alkaline phosphatase